MSKRTLKGITLRELDSLILTPLSISLIANPTVIRSLGSLFVRSSVRDSCIWIYLLADARFPVTELQISGSPYGHRPPAEAVKSALIYIVAEHDNILETMRRGPWSACYHFGTSCLKRLQS